VFAEELARARAPAEYASPLCVVKEADPVPIVSDVVDVAE
jgi:hypothetical protein